MVAYDAVEAVPVKLPTKVTAVTMPEKYPSPLTQSFDVGLVVPNPTLKELLPVIQELLSEPITNWSEPVIIGNWTL